MADTVKEAVTDAAAAPKSSSRIVPILLGVNSVALVGVLAVVLLRGSGSEAKSSGAESHSESGEKGQGAEGNAPGPTVRLSDFTVRLRGTEGDRYARLSLEVEVATEKDKEELSSRIPQLRDAFIRYLAELTLDDFTGGAAIGKTKGHLTQLLHEVAPSKGVKNLYITDLVVQ